MPNIPAPAMTGIDNKNENFADFLGENPKYKEIAMVIPDRDIPGIIANACPRPITIEGNNEYFEFLFLKMDDNIKTKPVNNKAKPTLFTLSNKISILFLSVKPIMTAGIVAIKIYNNSFCVDFFLMVISIFKISGEKTKSTLPSVPRWNSISSALPGDFTFSRYWPKTRCPELLTGKNSVKPCKMPNIMISTICII